MIKPDQKVVFAVSSGDDIGPAVATPVVLLGVSNAAWDYMKDGQTHTFDLTSIGLDIKIVLFGAATRTDALEMIRDGLARQGKTLIDASDQDFGIKP